MKKNLISVIVPIYNVENYLEKCIDSILNQTYQNLEVILVDDGSPDNCAKICDEYANKDSRVVVLHKENGGVSSARNLGLEKAKGEFITFVDSDDYLEPTMYEKLIQKQQLENLDIVFARYKEIYESGEVKITETALEDFCKTSNLVYTFNCSSKKEKLNGETKIHDRVFCSLWRMLFKSEVLKGIKFSTKIRYMEDFVFFNEVALYSNIKFGFIDEYLYNYLIRGTSAYQTKSKKIVENSKGYLEEMTRILSGTKYEDYLPALEYFCYSECVLAKYVYGENIDYKDFKAWGTKNNYKCIKRIILGLKSQIKYFLIRHKMYILLKFLYKVKN